MFLRLPPSLRESDAVAVSVRDVEQLLRRLTEHVVEVTQTRLTNVHATIEDYNAATTGLTVPHVVVALAGFPAGFDRNGFDLLDGLVRNGPRAGVHLVVGLDRAAETPRGFRLRDLTDRSTQLAIEDGTIRWNDRDFADYPLTLDPLPAAERANAWLDAVAEAASSAVDSVPFDRIAVPAAERWKGSSALGLRIQIGVDARGEPQWLVR